ncbi:microtubule-associated protein 9 isoform X4 [Triplophysa rosa]|uniref:microtubule-associated protein 9 isoform X4 n=1 Tax=Triplophysa rosa TaxID=992332 RepID=UPI0025460FFA|nr:microtubule-associated protein 9 isoform X4 [Triplophysa rosa]
MDDDIFSTTLAYTKSPKTSRRTTFQYELEAAVSARANRQKPSYRYSDDFDDDDYGKDDDDDDDDMLGKLLRIQKQKKDRFKAGKTKGKINDFKLSDDEEKNVKPHKVSFLKTKRNSSPVHTEQLDSMRSDSHHGSFHSSQSRSTPQSPWSSVTAEKIQQSDSPFSSQSDKPQPESTVQTDQSESVMKMRNQTESSLVRKSLSESPLPLNSENSRQESSVPLLSEGSQWDSPVSLLSEKERNQKMYFGEECELPIPHPRERSVKPKLPTAGCLAQDMSPRPMPRQKTGKMCDSGQLEENTEAETPACSGVATSSMSIVLSNTSSLDKIRTSTNDSVQGQCEDSVISEKSKTNSSSTQKHMSEAPTTAESEENREGTESTSFEENVSQSKLDHTFTVGVQTTKSTDRKSKSSYTAESKYLGTLKILDQKMQETQQIPDAADSLRAAVYQEWLKKKEENIKIKMRAKKQEEKLNEEKRQEEKLAKIADAKASYDAWKEKTVDVIRKKVKEKQEAINEQQMQIEKNQEKKETAIQQVFEKWKKDHDEILKERMREKKQNEKKEKQQQVREKEERKSDCTSAFIQWSAQKKNVIQERVREEHENNKINEMEEKYEKEEREKMALEMYDKWMRRKEFQQKRERKEKRIHVILQDEPPPPWSPPNKTIPFGK